MRFDYAEHPVIRRTRTMVALARQRGLVSSLALVSGWATFPLWRHISRKRFRFLDRELPYFLSNDNVTWGNERAVEVAIATSLIAEAGNGGVLEVGDVLSHYFSIKHDVVDKYERRPGVAREDAATFDLGRAFSLVLSLSTMEHVGWDENPRDPLKAATAIRNLERHVAPGGTLLVTIPLGHHLELDRMIAHGEIPFSRRVYMRRLSWRNDWKEVSLAEALPCQYGEPWLGASALFIGITHRPSR